MNFEYLIFNLIVISGPAFFGSLKCCYIWHHLKTLLIAIAIPAIPFLLWDIFVTGTHWHFNPKYVSGIKIINLPIEEILFFITVPFACLFTWEMIVRRVKEKTLNLNWLRTFLYLTLPAGIYFFSIGKQYTGLTLSFIFLANIVDQFLKTNLLFDKRFYFYLLLIVIFTLIFNGFLTWRPVVTYGVEYQLDFRIITIP
ncbi:MAG: lycopene cyclase domain-containing protein, partial [Ignavibacteriaceae bacterium]|nr:lycopene cyclase domain-containing protein [Ignavibacteriaceae bacterium]